MRLERHTHPTTSKFFPYRGQRRRYGGGMMCVIVHQRHAAPRTEFFEPAMNPGKVGHAVTNRSRCDADFVTQRRRGQGIEHIVLAHQRDHQFGDELSAAEDAEPITRSGPTDIARPPIGVHRPTERHHRGARRLRCFPCGGIFGAGQQ